MEKIREFKYNLANCVMERAQTLPWLLFSHVDFNQRPDIFKDISHIQFTNLTLLRIPHNYIKSIEGLSFLHMPHL